MLCLQQTKKNDDEEIMIKEREHGKKIKMIIKI